MPIYVQECIVCKHRFDDYRTISRFNQNPHCPKCFNNTERCVATVSTEKDWGRPILSDAMACDPERVAERERATGIKHMPDGRPILHNRAERAKMMQHLGFHDRAGYYSKR